MAMMATQRDRCDWALDDGVLRAIADGEGAEGWRPEVDAHVRQCETCRDRSQAIRLTGAVVHGRLVTGIPAEGVTIRPPTFEAVHRASLLPWYMRVVAPSRPRESSSRSWVVKLGAAAAAVALAASAPTMSSFADGALQSFRVQRVQPITVDADALRSRLSGLSIDEAKLREALRYRGPEKPTITITSQADAAARSGLIIRLPKSVPSVLASRPARFVVASGGTAEMTLDGPRLIQIAKDAKVTDAAVLARIGALDGAAIKIDGYPAVVAVWGDLDIPTQVPSANAAVAATPPPVRGPVLVIGQMKSPVVNVPASVDVAGLRDSLIASGAVPPELVQAFSAIKDWRTTLPVPSGGTNGLRQLTVDGVSATVSNRSHDGKTITSVVWVRDGVIYGAVSDLPESDVLVVARSLPTVKS